MIPGRERRGEQEATHHPFDSHFWGEDDEESHSLRGIFGSVIRPPIFEGVSFMFDLVVFIPSIEQIVVMNN